MFENFKEYGYGKYKKVRYKVNKLRVKRKARHIKLNELVSNLKNIGIEEGDILLVHSSLKKIGFVEGGPKTVIEALLKVISSEGTLVIPTYPLSGTMLSKCLKRNYIFDYKTTHTGLGSIPSEFLKLKGIYRSIHPTHSISAFGKYAKEITEKHHIGNKTYGINSPWAKIIEKNGKFLGIGITLGPTTQYHYIEDFMSEEFPIRVNVDEIYNIKCKINENEYINVAVQPLDPIVAETRIDKKKSSFIRDYFWEIFLKLGILNIGQIGEAKSWWIDAKIFCDKLIELAKIGITIYSSEEQVKNNKLYPFKMIKDRLN